jgi:tRNA(Ile)-lysidine synthase
LDTILRQAQVTIQQDELLVPGETVVVGVSGGPDSLCLLHLLCQLCPQYDLSLHVAHLHHGLRGSDADGEAEFVQAVADEWGLPCSTERVDVPGLAGEHKLSLEEAARRARYAFLGQVAAREGANAIAVGHNADDQAETILMHFIRGSGLAGLRGMLPRTSLEEYRLLQPPAANLQIIRPLLEVTRAEIEAYCDHHGLEPRFDRSNLDTTYFRNWLRHEVLPLLCRHNPNVRQVIRRSSKVITDDYALLRSLLEEAWTDVVLEESPPLASPSLAGGIEGGHITLLLAAWRALPTSLQRSTLREAIHRLRRSLRNINFQHVENALLVARDGTTGDQATLPQGLMLTVGYDDFIIAPVQAPQPMPDWPLLPPETSPLPLSIPGDTKLPDSDWALRAKILTVDDLTPEWAADPNRWQAFLDADLVGRELWLRTRVPGDRFQPQGMDGRTVKLGDFFTNQKVLPAARDRLPLMVSRFGIAWVCGWRVDERAQVRDTSQRLLVARFVR